jgi:hypothetical protein
VTATPREAIVEVLGRVGAASTFAAARTGPAGDLHLEVKGLGRLRLPVSPTQARRLCRLGRPARYGRGEQTLLDRRVRDTCEIPKGRVRIDGRRWNRTLLPVLDALRADLGLPDGTRLRAALHSMLVYGPGQFFLPHQDSETSDDMVATLVVTLPSPHRGGAAVIEHQGEKSTFRASRQRLSFLAFYAGCRHEVRPIRDGHRIALTYDLSLSGRAQAGSVVEPAQAGALAACLRRYFETPAPTRPRGPLETAPKRAPSRLVYLLDHQYTERGLGWHRLKGADARRSALLRAAGERAGCDVALALAEVHETWSCVEEDEPWHRGGRWRRDDEEDDGWDEEDGRGESAEGYELEDLQDWSIELRRWTLPSGDEAEPIGTVVGDDEVCSTTPSSDLDPYKSEHEGYMGNYGNTVDRWYRRGALVLWPRERAFAVRGEASPRWALGVLAQRIRAGKAAEARRMAESLLPFWKKAAGGVQRGDFFERALRVAAGLDAAVLAASLLAPFEIESLTPARARSFAALVERYGEDWTRSLLGAWSGGRGWGGHLGDERYAWLSSLGRLCEGLRARGGAAGAIAARLVLEDQWRWSRSVLEQLRDLEPVSQRREQMEEVARPVLGWLEGAAVAEAADLRDEALAFLCAGEDGALLPCLMRVLRAAPAASAPAALDVLGRHCGDRLAALLAQPERADGDWSIAPPRGCRCDLCQRLAAFLADPQQRRLEWPLAQQKRRHIHGTLDAHELPVLHRTRRSGSPFTLLLEKTQALFQREADERRRWRADLDWLAARARARA